MFKDETESAFKSSPLGTKEHWDAVYAEELKNFSEHGDQGEVWFGQSVVVRLIAWFRDRYRSTVGQQWLQASVLDIGTGNGMLLSELSVLGFVNLTGVDYSESAIKLAQEIANQLQASIVFQVGNILQPSDDCGALKKTYDVCTDKGTYDAISLDPDDADSKKRIYVKRVAELLNSDGLLVLTSCNWTKDELSAQFDNEFQVFDDIPMRQFRFGGQVGQDVTSVVFRKKSRN